MLYTDLEGVPASPLPTTPLRSTFAFLDIEASGLHDTSYPIEIGWADDGLNVERFLIRRPECWTAEDWVHGSEQVHGISRERLMDEGIDIHEAIRRLDEAMRDKTVFSDNPRMEAFWLRRLYDAAHRRVPFEVADDKIAIGTHLRPRGHEIPTVLVRYAQAENLAEVHYPHIHRAGPDAAALAAIFRMTVDQDFFETVLQHDGLHPRFRGSGR